MRTESKRLLRIKTKIRAPELTTGIRPVYSVLQNHTCLSCSLRRSSVTPRALIPRARQAACSSLTVRVSTPSSAIICKMERKSDRVRAQNRGTTATAQPEAHVLQQPLEAAAVTQNSPCCSHSSSMASHGWRFSLSWYFYQLPYKLWFHRNVFLCDIITFIASNGRLKKGPFFS